MGFCTTLVFIEKVRIFIIYMKWMEILYQFDLKK